MKVTIDDDQVAGRLHRQRAAGAGRRQRLARDLQATAAIPFLYYVDPDIPHNHGCIKHIEVVAPKDRSCNARLPGVDLVRDSDPIRLHARRHQHGDGAGDSRARPGGGHEAVERRAVLRRSTRPASRWGVMLFNGTGGGGAATAAMAGRSSSRIDGHGRGQGAAVEQIELLYPLRIERMEIEPDSMGFGEWIGGPGTRLVVRPLGGPAGMRHVRRRRR